jgi:hypothetical protein
MGVLWHVENGVFDTSQKNYFCNGSGPLIFCMANGAREPATNAEVVEILSPGRGNR